MFIITTSEKDLQEICNRNVRIRLRKLAMDKDKVKIAAKNRKARFNYEILDSLEAGIVLTGTEVKSIRQGKVNLSDAFAVIKHDEVFLKGMHISPYDHGNRFNVDPLRERKLLLKKQEIYRLKSKTEQKGLTLVPLSLYFKNGRVKLDLGIAKGKKLYDKRESIKQDEIDRKLRQNFA